jgi:hypothetical protein
MSGFDTDFKNMMELNLYGSNAGDSTNALMGMMGLRYLLGQKYGGLGQTIKDLDMPESIRQLHTQGVNLVQTPSLPQMVQAGIDTAGAWGVGNQRSTPGGYVGDGKPAPNINPTNPSPQGVNTPVATTPGQNAAGAQAAQQQQAAGSAQNRPDDVLTIVDKVTGKVTRQIPRSEWDASSPVDRNVWNVVNAQANPQRPDMQPSGPAPTAPAPSTSSSASEAAAGTPPAPETYRPNDVLTVRNSRGVQQVVTRSAWDKYSAIPENAADWEVINAEPAGTRPITFDPAIPPHSGGPGGLTSTPGPTLSSTPPPPMAFGDRESSDTYSFAPARTPLDTNPSMGLTLTNTMLADAEEEERRRKRQQALLGIPNSIMGMLPQGYMSGFYPTSGGMF